jgi:hypothetical protein
MMAEQNPRENHKVWVEVLIVFLVVLSVLGAALLTQQDQPVGAPAPLNAAQFFSPTPRPVTPTPTQAASSVAVTSVAAPVPTRSIPPAEGTSLSTRPATPTPTQTPLATVVGGSE